ncbi:hypothetical protein M9Y10_033470 [Tritrichomonas musculus]|uniref:Haloacid dehalogenase-like hydrolase n=1 Tax=Tritrichomonas musculus TaxID=1915356 RepID=A0ABR2KD00_9EUKA
MEKEKEEVDIYDFDKTLVPFDSGILFCLYCLIHYPWIIILLPFILVPAILLLLRIINLTTFKKFCFIFVPFIPLQKAVKNFWDKYEKDVHKWFFNRKRTCVVISASPDFLLNEISQRIHIDHLICTRHNKKTGCIIGENCFYDEKVKRFREEFGNTKVIDVYSDSLKHDQPIFSLATGQCFHIVKSKLCPFEYKQVYGSK